MLLEGKKAVVTGGTRGIGFAVVETFLKNGASVALFGSRQETVDKALAKLKAENPDWDVMGLAPDLTDYAAVEAAMAKVTEAFGRIDILVNNAGFGISGAVEFTSTEDAKALFDVNFFGMVNLNRAVVPIMRAAGRGRIVNLSSVAAPVPIPFQTYYSATKAAVNAYTMALANELRPFGVTVCAVMPGDIHTGFTAARRKIGEGDDIYHGRISRSVARMEHDEQTGMDPAKAGGYIAGVALRAGNRHPLYAIRFDYKFFTFLAKVLPARFLNWLIYLLYGK